ncbi:MAG: hypothetical protein OXL41_08375 [Nitrospinae bacterium]|nr:hypothetical protein [Nitrospinota bacterium]
MTLDIPGLMVTLSKERSIFHSEADFQHALAWRLHKAMPNDEIRLEYKPFQNERMYLDIWLPGVGVALELKYLTKRLEQRSKQEPFALLDQGAQDIRRYDVLRDVQRLERMVAHAEVGYAILLTNDPLYWRPPSRPTIDEDFRLHEGREIAGDMAWSLKAAEGTTNGREKPISLKGSYYCVWRDYFSFGAATNQQFRYLMIEVR